MEKKLINLYKECIEELKSIGINIEDKENIGEIKISLSKRNNKRYGCCKQYNPQTDFCHTIFKKYKKIKIYDKFLKHDIEVSKWVMELKDIIIKNTIMHELIHCMPYCNNHGKEFKKYANYINEKLGYSIKRLGNKAEDYENSNIEFNEKNKINYTIRCKDCGIVFYRQRLKKNFVRNYRCGKCKGKLELISK